MGLARKKEPDDNRRDLILATTLRLIAENGIDSITHRKVAAAANIPLGSTTYHFRSRAHLIRDTFEYFLEQTRERHSANAGLNKITTAEDLAVFLERSLQIDLEDEELLMAEFELTIYAARDAGTAEMLQNYDQTIIAGIAQSLETLGAGKPFDSARMILHLMRGYQIELITRHVTDSGDFRRWLTSIINSACCSINREKS